MPAMKLTPTAAMRARDVSRPRAEHLAEAEATEASPPASSRERTISGDTARGSTGREVTGGTGTGGTRRGGAYRR